MTPKFITTDDKLITEVNDFIAEWRESSSIISVNTSGSTGIPKLIELHKSNMIASAQMTGQFFNLKEGNSILLSMSPKTIGGMMVVVRAIVLNLKLIITDVSTTPLHNINEPIDFAAMVPIQVKASLESFPEKFDLIKTLIIGGGALSKTLENQIKRINGAVYHTFGMTETISHVALRNMKIANDCFHVLDGVTVDVENDCLVIHSSELGLNRLVTNDIVELTSNTSFKWLGRSDFAINSGGIKIIPAIIEDQLNTLIQANFFSIGIPDQKLGQRHILIIESNEDFNLKKLDFKLLDNYKIPKEIYYLEKFRYTSSGKVNRHLTLASLANAKKQVL